ncbi:MAG: hypothetical protein ACLP5H_11415 [Desulfomonilaceae bacterium]
MFRIIVREILILVLSLAVFPAAVILLLVYKDPLGMGPALLAQEMIAGEILFRGTPLTLWVKLFSPYLVLQAIRGFLWSQRSLVGRRWANLYFSVLAATWAGRSLWGAWDLFYFMYALGDMPAQLGQFFRLEAINLLTFLACAFIAIYCFGIFLDPRRRQQAPRGQTKGDDGNDRADSGPEG